MKTIACRATAFLVSTSYLSSRHYAQAMMVGDEVCTTGYIMDNFCIERGTLLDDADVITLQNPEEHSFHCLLDVSVCYESGFMVLGEKDATTDRHCLGFRLDDTDAVLETGRATGTCDTCTSTNVVAPSNGYRATVKGTVKELGDGSDGVSGTPILKDVEMLDASVGCGGNPTIPPLCLASSSQSPSVEPMPASTEPVEQPTPTSTETVEQPTSTEPVDQPTPTSTSTEPVDQPTPTSTEPDSQPTPPSTANVRTIASTTTFLVLLVFVFL